MRIEELGTEAVCSKTPKKQVEMFLSKPNLKPGESFIVRFFLIVSEVYSQLTLFTDTVSDRCDGGSITECTSIILKKKQKTKDTFLSN